MIEAYVQPSSSVIKVFNNVLHCFIGLEFDVIDEGKTAFIRLFAVNKDLWWISLDLVVVLPVSINTEKPRLSFAPCCLHLQQSQSLRF